MVRASEMVGVRVFRFRATNSKTSKADDSMQRLQRVGKVHTIVVAPDTTRVVGVMVKRPDVAGMVKRQDIFVDLEALDTSDAGLIARYGDASFGDAAARRAGVDLDACVVWVGMDVRTEDGQPFGYVGDLTFDATSGQISSIFITEGGVSDALIGAIEVPISQVCGYEAPHIVVKNAARTLERAGGFAAHAGEASAKAAEGVAQAGARVADAADKAVAKGTFELGRVVGKARRAVVEATQAEPEIASLPATDVQITDASCTDSAQSDVQSAKSQDSSTPIRHNTKTKQSATTAEHIAQQGARKLGKSLRRTKGMFSSFKEEFDKNSR